MSESIEEIPEYGGGRAGVSSGTGVKVVGWCRADK